MRAVRRFIEIVRQPLLVSKSPSDALPEGWWRHSALSLLASVALQNLRVEGFCEPLDLVVDVVHSLQVRVGRLIAGIEAVHDRIEQGRRAGPECEEAFRLLGV